MNGLRIIPFDPIHLISVFENPLEERLEWTRQEDAEDWGRIAFSKGPGWTAVYQNQIVACAGVMIMWKGVGEAWVFFSKLMEDPELRRAAYVQVLEYLARVISKHDLHRVQATCRVDFPPASQYLERLGFEFEGLLRQYGYDRVDYRMYSMMTKEVQA